MSLRGLWWRTLVSIAGVALLAVTVVLPAEWGRDITGAGNWLGVARTPQLSTEMLRRDAYPFVVDEVHLALEPFQSLEYKYRLDEGESMFFSWEASDELVFEFHGEADEGPEGEAETYSLGRNTGGFGKFIAPMSGVHGWYWQNRNLQRADLVVRVAGHVQQGIEIGRSGEYVRELREGSGQAPSGG